MLSAVILLAYTDADIPFAVCFGYAYGDVGVLGATHIRPVTFAVMEAICDTVGHTLCCTEPISHADGFSVESLVITILGGETA